MIRVTDLVKFHGPAKILDGVNLTVQPGEVVALVGPSGGGKSTLLRCINGLEAFHTGRVEAFGHALAGSGGKPHPIRTLIPLRQKVGMVFQQFHLFPHLTAAENVMAGPVHVLKQSRTASGHTAERLLERVGLSDRRNARPGELSGGQQQRVAIARTLAVNPAAILFDEPTSALDPQMADEVLAVMRDLARDGMTMIVVTHDMDLAKRANTVHKMAAGRIVQSGSPADVLGV